MTVPDDAARDVVPGTIQLSAAWELSLPTALRLPRVVDLAFDALLGGEGWHPWETSGTTAFGWMGRAEEAHVELAIDRSVDLALDLGIYLMIEPAFGAQLRILVDDDVEPTEHRRTADGVTLVLPRRPDDTGPTRITIRAGKGIVNLPDPRRLSIAFSHLRVRPVADDADGSARLILRERLADRLRAAEADWPLRHDDRACLIVSR